MRVNYMFNMSATLRGTMQFWQIFAKIGPPWRTDLAHINTHLWDLSTNLSKLNIFLKLKNIVLYES